MDHKNFLLNLNDNLLSKPVDDLKNEQFSLEVASGRVKFLSVVESLQGVLTNDNLGIRERGIEFLSWLLSKLPEDLFNSSEISVLVNFYCDVLKGHHNFTSSAVTGLLELVKMKHITKQDLVNILVNLFQHVNCQTQLQPDRIMIYSILKYVVEKYLEDVRQMGPDLVFGIMSLIEGEADPICLNLIFNYLPIFIQNFDLGHLAEEMFEVLSCYFPIDFNPPSKENFPVTREDLSENLHKCLTASDSFSEQSLLLILEKADSSFKNAKLDSYKLLRECCKTVKIENLEKHCNHLWKILSKDVLPGNEKQVCDAGLLALTDIFHLLSKDESHFDILTTFLQDILTTVKSLASRIDENLFQPAIKVLIAITTECKPAARKVLCHLKTFSQLECSNTLTDKKIILTSLLPFLKICNRHKMVETQNDEELMNYQEFINLYLDSATSVDYEIRKLAFLGVLDVLPHSDQVYRKRLYKIILENFRTKSDIRLRLIFDLLNIDLEDQLLQTLSISEQVEALILELCKSKIFVVKTNLQQNNDEFLRIWRSLAQNHQPEFQNFISENFLNINSENCFQNFLWALSLIGDIPEFTSYFISTVLKVIDDKQNYKVAFESLLNACRVAKTNESTYFFHVIHSEHNVFERLVLWCLEFKTNEELYEGEFLRLLTEIIALITRNQNSNVQQAIADKITPMFFKGASHLNSSGDFILSDNNLVDFSHDIVPAVLILEAILASVRSEVVIPMFRTLREKLTDLALSATVSQTTDFVRLSSSRLLASFVNKADDSLVLDLLNEVHKRIFAQLEENCELSLKLNATFLFTWILKGVILRGGHISEKWISIWFSLLGRKDIGETIAEGFRTVIEEDDLYLNLESHCNVKVLYRQKLFGNHSTLIKMYEVSDLSVRMNYLLALVRLFQGVPIYLIQTEISSIIIILVRCLDVNKPEILSTALEILASLLESKEKIFSDYIQSFVPNFLKLARFEGYMKIRINALKCLYFYGFYPTVTLLPIKNMVIRDLESCLDDKKRLVRKEAVRARCRWFLVGAPGEDILDL